MGRKQDVEREMYAQLANYKKLNKVKKEIENSEYWGITRRLEEIDSAAKTFASKAQTPSGYEYAAAGFDRMHANAQKMQKMASEYREWRNAQIDMRTRVTEEMRRISEKVWGLQNDYNAKKDEGDMFEIHIAEYPWNW